MLIGHQFQWQYLKNLAEMREIPHAFLFSGPDQVGKRRVAIEFVKLLFGPENRKTIEKGIHPDLTLIEPKGRSLLDKTLEGKQIQISQIRKLNSYFNLCSYSAPFKVAIIDEAHCMNTEAQSSFLKLLEEPRGRAIFVLITPCPRMLLPTILSRTQIIKFYKVSEDDLKKYLQNQGIAQETINEIMDFYDGRPGQILDFLSDPRRLEDQKERILDIVKLMRSDLFFRFQYAKNLSKDPQKLSEVLDFWLRYFRKIFISKIKNMRSKQVLNSRLYDYTLANQGSAERSEAEPYNGYSLNKLRNILRILQNTNFLISTTNVNPRLALQILMLEL